MAPRIIIERLECYGRCGVTEEERGKPQLIAIFIGVIAAAIIITGYLFNMVI